MIVLIFIEVSNQHLTLYTDRNNCPNRNYRNTSGYIASSGYPDKYGIRLNCQYDIECASHQQIVQLIFERFNLQHKCCDSVYVDNGITETM